jgi:hypothetical protein
MPRRDKRCILHKYDERMWAGLISLAQDSDWWPVVMKLKSPFYSLKHRRYLKYLENHCLLKKDPAP